MTINKLLIVVAHPDDEVLMCGATARRLANEGTEIQTLILGEGITSRDRWTKDDVSKLHEQAKKANQIIGSDKVHIYDFPDNKFDIVSLLSLVKVISKIKDEFAPGTIITHFRNDLNIDHRRTYDAVITATRPTNDEPVRTILSGEVLSSTEWQYPQTFSPNVFYEISDTFNSKVSAMKIYESEIRNYPHPRSIQGILNIAQNWGMRCGKEKCEVFELIRDIKSEHKVA